MIMAIGFVIYEFNNPQASFSWSNSMTYEFILFILCQQFHLLLKV